MTQALYRKWRSRTFSELVGQPHVVQTLENALRTNRLAHAYLFNGPRGTGKTSSARLLAKALNCTGAEGRVPCGECTACTAIEEGRYLDLIEIDAASNNGVDDIRELRSAVNFSPTEGRCKVYIVDEVHMLSTSAFNALLKTLEEPPDHVYFILATTEIHRIPATVISRCQRFDFRRIRARDIKAHLAHIAQEEHCDIEPTALTMIAESAQGCMRDAISLLDQVVSYGRDRVSLNQVQSILGLSDIRSVNDLMDCLTTRNKAEGLRVLQTVADQGGSLTEFLQQVTYQLRYVFRYKVSGDEDAVGDVSPEQKKHIAAWVQAWDEIRLLYALSVCMDTLRDLSQAQHPHVLIELALIQAMDGPIAPAVPQVAAPPRSQSVPKPPPKVQATAAKLPSAVPELQPDQSLTGEPADWNGRQPPRVPADQVPKLATEEAQLKKLRGNWKELRDLIQQQASKDTADLLTGRGGMTGLRIVDQIVYIFLRDQQAVSQLGPQADQITERFKNCLGMPVQLRLQVEQEVELPPAGPAGAQAAAPVFPPATRRIQPEQPVGQHAQRSLRVPADQVPKLATEEAQLSELRANWKDLLGLIHRQASKATADLLTGRGGMTGLRIVDQSVYIFLRDRQAVSQLRPQTERITERFEGYLDMPVQLRLQVEQEVDTQVADTLSTVEEVEKFLTQEKGAKRLPPQELDAVWAQMQSHSHPQE